jgi:hypothetical protein
MKNFFDDKPLRLLCRRGGISRQNSGVFGALAATIGIAFALPQQTSAALVAYWNFDSDFRAAVGGSDFDLDAFNGASRSAAESVYGGSSASFSRASSQYLFTDSGSGNILDRNSDFTYSVWYYLDVANITGSDRYFVMEATENDSVGGAQSHPISLGLRDDNGDLAQVYTSVDNTSDRHYQWSTTPNQQWHNVITTYDSSSETLTSYFNGVEVGSAEVPIVGVNDDEQPLTSNNDIGNGLVIGGHRGGTGRNFEGYIDDVAVWDEVIDSSEITRLQSNPVVVVPEPSVAAAIMGLSAMIAVTLRRRLVR